MIMNLRQNGILSLCALWNSTHSMQFPCLGQLSLGQLQLGFKSCGMRIMTDCRVYYSCAGFLMSANLTPGIAFGMSAEANSSWYPIFPALTKNLS